MKKPLNTSLKAVRPLCTPADSTCASCPSQMSKLPSVVLISKKKGNDSVKKYKVKDCSPFFSLSNIFLFFNLSKISNFLSESFKILSNLSNFNYDGSESFFVVDFLFSYKKISIGHVQLGLMNMSILIPN